MSPKHHQQFPNVAAAIAAFQAGRPVLLLDDNDREDEADIVAAAENISLQTMAMMIRDCSGIVCLCLDETTVDTLQLAPMVQNNQARHGTGFTVTIEAAEGITTGVSAHDRITTIAAALSSTAEQRNIVSPGHVFPLRARNGGVLTRRGHTEGTVDLARLAGLRAAGVLCELMNPDGSMARGEQVALYARENNMPMLTIEELAQYRQVLVAQEAVPA
ncbi:MULTISPECIES: 3,4-dihydroxy-2-butanone-4-phosphate synthase [Pseudomonas]|uniref:3,4-dihydroxy 2-butanone 4-phosphate synthase n=1 Tax=Pseudomonas hunanensis TaxID=1247546 RepID=A0ACC6K085_9PSED|nr:MULTISPECIES: 3,4-dihydroxy-2-butanone-4-phosphate synthase [Pseudomonas]MBP2264446.1 3,4-dihydroxy 2-butanone 4-phosphate synthase [Pseudomonas sp. BP8]MDR6711865.1 3,4-dihydroxy 2-butanone 4-phosphate synthase [Pseudomonas hunanensis]HDS1737619.1 3,4-dihydroxy-2-butanone-4-phosphate synthase [Pseudomonas putida]